MNTQEVFEVRSEVPISHGWGVSLFNASLAKNVSSIADQVVQADLANFLYQPYRAVDITPGSERLIPCSHIPGQENKLNCRRVYYIPGGLELAVTQEMKNKMDPDADIILAENQQGYILDFTEGPVGEDWSFKREGDCMFYGFPFSAFHLCLKNGAANTLHARKFTYPVGMWASP